MSLSRKYILEWLHSIDINIENIEDIGKGTALCEILAKLDKNFPKYKKTPTKKMVNLKLQDNLEVAQWFCKYWEKQKKADNTIPIERKPIDTKTEVIQSISKQVPSNGQSKVTIKEPQTQINRKIREQDLDNKKDSLMGLSKFDQNMGSSSDKSHNNKVTDEKICDNCSELNLFSKLTIKEKNDSPLNTSKESEEEIQALKLEIESQNKRITTLRNYVRVSYNETKFYFEKLQKIESIFTDVKFEFTEETKQRILDILYED